MENGLENKQNISGSLSRENNNERNSCNPPDDDEIQLPGGHKDPTKNNPNNPKAEDQSQQNKGPVSRFVDEGNPNTEGRIKEAQKPKSKKRFSHQDLTAASTRKTQASQRSKTLGQPSQEKSTASQVYSDQELKDEIFRAIRKERFMLDAKEIQVSVENGVVTLMGTVKSDQEKMTLGDKAAAFAGFGKVNNNLQVMQSN